MFIDITWGYIYNKKTNLKQNQIEIAKQKAKKDVTKQ